MKRLLPFLMVLLFIYALVLGSCTKYSPTLTTDTSPDQSSSTPTIKTPSAPTTLIAKPQSQSTAYLQWADTANNEDGFKIYRDGNVVGTVAPNSQSYQDTGLTAGKTYNYLVRAYNSAGESEGSVCTLNMPNPALNMKLNHIGVKFDHDPSELLQGSGDIKLILFITDGKQSVSEMLPSDGSSSYSLNDYQTIQLNIQVFRTQSAGDFLKVVLIAYEDDPESLVSDIIQTALPILDSIVDIPYATEISAIFSLYQQITGKPLFENKDDYVGSFTGLWGADQSWGIGQHQAVGTEDFLVWFSIWSDTEPPAIPKPTLVPPSLTIISYGFSPNPITVGNVVNVTISMAGGIAGTYSLDILKDITLGTDQLVTSYTISHDGNQTTQSFLFRPDTVGSYHLRLMYSGKTVWSQPNDSSRLIVSSPSVQQPSVQTPETITEPTISTELKKITFSWEYETEWTWELEIPVAIYDYFKQLPRIPTKNYSVYVTHPLDDPYINGLAEKLNEAAQSKNFGSFQIVEFAASFVQSLPYTSDSVTTSFDEYPRFPIETIFDNGGDCEDTSILLASILDKMGYDVVLINLPNHVAVGVKGSQDIYGSYYNYQGNRYYYIETTGENWGIGELPDEYKNTNAYIYPMVPVPILSADFETKNVQYFLGIGYTLDLDVTVSNLGSAIANSVTIWAGFDAGGGLAWNGKTSQSFTVGVNQQRTVTMNLKVPSEAHTRLIVKIINDGILMDERFTDWFDT